MNKPDQHTFFSSGIPLLVVTLITIFIAPLFSGPVLRYFYPACFSCIFLLAGLTLKEHHTTALQTAIITIALVWINVFTENPILGIIGKLAQFFYFFAMVAALIYQVAFTSEVKRKAIIDAITGYFLLGLSLNMLVIFAAISIPNAYNINGGILDEKGLTQNLLPVQEYLYYAFVTYTTTGYGDILPTHAVTKSLAILIGVSGQLYVATILAMLIGKYSSSQKVSE